MRSIRTSDISDRIAAATRSVNSSATAVEVGIIYNSDHSTNRRGEIVFLSEDSQIITAFANRCDVDLEYPTRKMNGADWFENKQLSICSDEGVCVALKIKPLTGMLPAQIPKGQVLFREFENHDVSLLYFNADDVHGPVVGLGHPEQELKEYLTSASTVFSQRMIVMSERCFTRIKRWQNAKKPSGALAELVISIFVSRWLGALLGRLGRASPSLVSEVVQGMVEPAVSQRLAGALFTRNVNSVPLPTKRPSGARSVNNDGPLPPESFGSAGHFLGGKLLLTGHGDDIKPPKVVHLSGVLLPAEGAEQDAIGDFLKQTLSELELQFVDFSYPDRDHGGILFAPEINMVVNYELIRHGLARVDLNDEATLQRFPEFVTAANLALNEGIGFSARWKTDLSYVRSLARS